MDTLLIHAYVKQYLTLTELIRIIEQYFKDQLIIWKDNDFKKILERVNVDQQLHINKYFMNGNSSMMIITNDNSLYCIGSNSSGQFGVSNKVSGEISNPFKHPCFSNTNIKTINEGVYGNHNFIVLDDNDKQFYAFGINNNGELGINKVTDYDPWYEATPTKVTLKESIESIKCGARFTLLLSSSPSYNVYSCGENAFGQLGLSDTIDRKQFILIKTFENVKCKYIVCGINSSYVIDEFSNVYCFGTSANGRLGLGDSVNVDQSTPMLNKYFVDSNIKISQIQTGDRHVCCLSESNDVFTFGHNRYGMCGNGTIDDVWIPYKVKFENINNKLFSIKKIECGSGHTMILDYNSNLYVFGSKCFGFESNILKPQLVSLETLKIKMNDLHVQKIVDIKASCDSYIITN